MSTIRFRDSTAPASTQTGTSKLFVDVSDEHLKRKLANGSIIDYDAAISPEEIQDAIGSILTDTTTIDLTYDDAGNEITASIVANSINSSHVDEISPLKIGDNQNQNIQATVNTTDNTPTTILLLDCQTDGSLLVEANITCFRTGGISGAAGDSATFKRTFRVKTIAGTVTIHDVQADYTSRDDKDMKLTFSVSGTDVNIKVIGLLNNNIRWNCDVSMNKNN